MRYGSVCSGIEAATVAWHALGWTPTFFAEIEKFPSEVLAHHYPDVPNLGDMTRFQEWPDAALDVLVGGTPCQSFSVAGLRKGLADPRGNLALTYLAILDRYRPEWMVWENVPGVLSSGGGRDFGSFLGGLGELGYGFAYRVLDAQYVRVDGFGRAVPQRRRRVFVVGHSGDWRRAAAVLFERASLCGDPAPRREAGQGVAGTVDARASRGFNGHDAGNDKLIASRSVAATLTRGAESAGKGGYAGRRQEDDDNLVAHSLRGEGFDASEDGTGRGTPLVPIQVNGAVGSNGAGIGRIGDPAMTLQAGVQQAIAFDTTQITSAANRSVPKAGDPCHPLAAGAHPPAIAFNPKAGGNVTIGKSYLDDGTAYTLDTDCTSNAVQSGWAVRRLTPTECERLQGFPDGYTAITRNGKPAADGPRYKALGNSMACNVMRWIGRRIEMVDGLASELSTEEAA